MNKLSLYEHKDTLIHNWADPFTKLIYLICSMFAAFFIPSFTGAFVILLINIVLLAIAKELGRAFKTILGSAILLITIFVIQGLFHPGNHTLVFSIGPVHFYEEGLLFGLTIAFRVINIIAASCVLVLTTSPSDVMEASVRRGLSPKIGYVITAILQMIPVMMDSTQTIQEAQKSRGMRLEGNLWHRMKVFLPLMGPVVLSSFMTIQDKAMALEVRGFSVRGKPSFYREEFVPKAAVSIRILMVMATIAIIVWGIIG
jgi:energy-coupling factor transport system permease protein